MEDESRKGKERRMGGTADKGTDDDDDDKEEEEEEEVDEQDEAEAEPEAEEEEEDVEEEGRVAAVLDDKGEVTGSTAAEGALTVL